MNKKGPLTDPNTESFQMRVNYKQDIRLTSENRAYSKGNKSNELPISER